ncbi:hypothetical protein EPUL_004336 [Erysiphe pulchra]|uniref:Uncharacterized protein n=1 Tax=Erysiphe pulchra TaxID=225359 RepID=A0A2S4PTU8_9PEZI|nr:hypothetical protein EPUL_004336 [Erysiphe pulchra]
MPLNLLGILWRQAFTAIPSWPKSLENLEHNQTPDSRPDFKAKVFKNKLEKYLYDFKERNGYSKRRRETIIMRENSYPEYARPYNGVRWGTERFIFDNQWVVPYNIFLTKKCGTHINVKFASGVRAIKYLATYIHKGSDRATFAVPREYNKIEMSHQAQYIGPVHGESSATPLIRKISGNEITLPFRKTTSCSFFSNYDPRTNSSSCRNLKLDIYRLDEM